MVFRTDVSAARESLSETVLVTADGPEQPTRVAHLGLRGGA